MQKGWVQDSKPYRSCPNLAHRALQCLMRRIESCDAFFPPQFSSHTHGCQWLFGRGHEKHMAQSHPGRNPRCCDCHPHTVQNIVTLMLHSALGQQLWNLGKPIYFWLAEFSDKIKLKLLPQYRQHEWPGPQGHQQHRSWPVLLLDMPYIRIRAFPMLYRIYWARSRSIHMKKSNLGAAWMLCSSQFVLWYIRKCLLWIELINCYRLSTSAYEIHRSQIHFVVDSCITFVS